MDASWIKAFADVGVTAALIYLLLILGPRAGARLEGMLRWAVQLALDEARKGREQREKELRILGEKVCKWKEPGKSTEARASPPRPGKPRKDR